MQCVPKVKQIMASLARREPPFYLKFTLKAREMASPTFQILNFSRGSMPPDTPIAYRAFGAHIFEPYFTKSWIRPRYVTEPVFGADAGHAKQISLFWRQVRLTCQTKKRKVQLGSLVAFPSRSARPPVKLFGSKRLSPFRIQSMG